MTGEGAAFPRRLLRMSWVWGVAAALTACRGGDEPELRVLETVSLDAPGAATLAIDVDGRWWLGRPGRVTVRDTGGAVTHISMPGTAPARVLGWSGEVVHLRWGDSVAAFDFEADSMLALREGFGASVVRPGPKGTALFQGAGSGAVLLHDPLSLEPIAAWPAIARRTTALAFAREGDRLYQTLEEDGDAAILVRDLQSGRILGESELGEAPRWLAAAEDGMLYGAVREGRRITVVALRASAGELETVWRVRLEAAGEREEVEIRSLGGLLAVGTPAPEGTVRLLDPVDGMVIGRAGGEPLDFALSPAGELWVLYPGMARRLR